MTSIEKSDDLRAAEAALASMREKLTATSEQLRATLRAKAQRLTAPELPEADVDAMAPIPDESQLNRKIAGLRDGVRSRTDDLERARRSWQQELGARLAPERRRLDRDIFAAFVALLRALAADEAFHQFLQDNRVDVASSDLGGICHGAPVKRAAALTIEAALRRGSIKESDLTPAHQKLRSTAFRIV